MDTAYEPKFDVTSSVSGDVQNCDRSSTSSATKSREECIQYYLEYYFSDENLHRDRYLRNLMDSEGYVPISVLSTFNKMVTLNAVHSDIAEAAKKSPYLCLDEKSQRIKAHSLDFIVEIKVTEPLACEQDMWDQILTPRGLTCEHCKVIERGENKWLLYTDNNLAAIDSVSKLRDFEARLRHKSSHVSSVRRNVGQGMPKSSETRSEGPQMPNQMLFPVNRMVPGYIPLFHPHQFQMPSFPVNSQRQPYIFPFVNRFAFPFMGNGEGRPMPFPTDPRLPNVVPNVEPRAPSQTFQEEPHYASMEHYITTIRPEKNKRGQRHRQSNTPATWSSQ